ncbi:MAG: hypothetical protein IJ776_10680 [Paludibacteraceae bacterium]|nr:hypothetical protein [Paludibacteraceae bacterium]
MKILIPCGGLANRMRAMHAGRLWDSGCRIVWISSEECACPFNELWKKSEWRLSEGGRKWRWLLKLERRFPIGRFLNERLHMPALLRVWNTDEYEALMKYARWETQNAIDVIFSYSEFLSGQEYYREWFLLTPEMQERVERECKGFTDKMVGVHIRRTDNTWSIEKSPLEWFYEKMDEEIVSDDKVRFYVATDDEMVKESLRERYGERMITSDGDLRRWGNKEGVKQALAEMYALSRTKKIYGSYYSSFSEMAARLGDIELQIVKKENEDSREKEA